MRLFPAWYVMLCMITAAASLGFAYVTANNMFLLPKPTIMEVYPSPPSIKVEAVSFIYDIASNRYTRVSIEFTNLGEKTLTALISVVIFDAQGSQLASGTATIGQVAPKAKATAGVDLVWISGTVMEYTSCRIVSQETSVGV